MDFRHLSLTVAFALLATAASAQQDAANLGAKLADPAIKAAVEAIRENSIPFEASFEMDVRSAGPTALQPIDQQFHRAVDESAAVSVTRALGESFDPTNSWQGSQRALLLAIALSRP